MSAINDDYKQCLPLAQAFLNTSAKLLADSKGKEEEIGASFEGLSIEAIPHVQVDQIQRITTSNNYQYNTQQAQICFCPLPHPLGSELRASVLLAHEFTHVIDDIYDETKSINRLFDNLARNAPTDLVKQEQILRCAAAMIDDRHKSLKTEYLDEFVDYLRMEGSKVQDWTEIATSYPNGHTRLFQDETDGVKNGTLTCTSIPAEFLTFSTERMFSILNSSSTPDKFLTQYHKMINQSIINLTEHKEYGKYDPKVRLAALELIKDVTIPHLDLIASVSDNAALQQCCIHAKTVLEQKFMELAGSQISQQSSVFLNTVPFEPSIPKPIAPIPPVQVGVLDTTASPELQAKRHKQEAALRTSFNITDESPVIRQEHAGHQPPPRRASLPDPQKMQKSFEKDSSPKFTHSESDQHSPGEALPRQQSSKPDVPGKSSLCTF